MLPSVNDAEVCIVGNPENRRVRDFQSTATEIRLGRQSCVSWRDVLSGCGDAMGQLRTAESIRIDSPGENDQVLHALIRLGGGCGWLAHGEIGFLREQHRGFCTALELLSSVNTSFQNPPADIREMFDKWASHQRFEDAGLARPATALAPRGANEFRTLRATVGGSPTAGRVFLKPRFGSSASGVCALRWCGDREQLIAPIEIDRTLGHVRLFNSLRVRCYTSPEEIDTILSQLLPQEMICERWVPKFRLPDGKFDLRILVIAGEARHLVVRQSHHPMTNLHLGNRRGDVSEVRDAIGNQRLEACRQLAEDAAACFPDSLYAGVDILVSAKGEPLICEINAFGDLLPNLRHRDQSAYEAILRASYVCGHSV